MILGLAINMTTLGWFLKISTSLDKNHPRSRSQCIVYRLLYWDSSIATLVIVPVLCPGLEKIKCHWLRLGLASTLRLLHCSQTVPHSHGLLHIVLTHSSGSARRVRVFHVQLATWFSNDLWQETRVQCERKNIKALRKSSIQLWVRRRRLYTRTNSVSNPPPLAHISANIVYSGY